MSRRLAARWADDLTAPADPAVDQQLAALQVGAARFGRSVLAWLAVITLAALVWHVVGPVVSIGEAAGAWLAIAATFVAMIAVLAIASRRARAGQRDLQATTGEWWAITRSDAVACLAVAAAILGPAWGALR